MPMVGSLLCLRSKISQVPYSPPQANTLIIDKNGYIGDKHVAKDLTYYAILDNRADFSQSELGQVTIIVPEIGSVEIGGRTYKTTKIGNQTWLAENLDYKFEGIDINPTNTNPITPAAWYYNRDEATYGWNGRKDGLLYNSYAVQLMDSNRNIAFHGWHIAQKSDWQTLQATLTSQFGSQNVGIVIKSGDYWTSYSGTDSYQLCIQPSGFIHNNIFYSIGDTASFWTPNNSSYSYNTYLDKSNYNIYYDTNALTNGLSVRLVKDT